MIKDATTIPLDGSLNQTMLTSYLQNNIFGNEPTAETLKDRKLNFQFSEAKKLSKAFLAIVDNHLSQDSFDDDDPENDYAFHMFNSCETFVNGLESLIQEHRNDSQTAQKIFLAWISMLGKFERSAESSKDSILLSIIRKLYIASADKRTDIFSM